MDYDPENPLPSLERQAFEKYFNVETESMAAQGYAESNESILRRVALRVILENSISFNFDAFIPYLAMNYFDRFISRNRLPNVLGRVRDDILLAAISCLTLAWKMRDETFRFHNLMAKGNLKEDYKNHILAMELHILNGLQWQMRAVTAICFVLFFSEKIPVGRSIKRRTLNEIIIQSQGDISFTKFKPSVIAASALLAGCRFLCSNECDKYKRDLLATGYIKEEDLEACLKKTYEMCTEKHIQFGRNDKFNSRPRFGVKAEGTSSSISEIEEVTESSETEIDPTLTSRSPGKEPMLTTSEIMEEAVESENEAGLNFELEWGLWGSVIPEEWTIHSPDFRPEAPIADPSVGTSTSSSDDSVLVEPDKRCLLM